MAMATTKISGLLAGCGPFGRFLGWQLRMLARIAAIFKLRWLPWKKRAAQKLTRWHAAGSERVLVRSNSSENKPSVISFLDVYDNKTLRDKILKGDETISTMSDLRDFVGWVADGDVPS